MQKNYDRFLKHLSTNANILDFGCGPGRDSKYFIKINKIIKIIKKSHI